MEDHGYGRYHNQDCRCDVCKAAHAAYMRKWRARQKVDLARDRQELMDARRIIQTKEESRCNTDQFFESLQTTLREMRLLVEQAEQFTDKRLAQVKAK